MPTLLNRRPSSTSRKCSGSTSGPKRPVYRAVPSCVARPAIMPKPEMSPSSLPVEEEQQPDRDEAAPPDPSRRRARLGQPQLRPARPAHEGAEQAQRRVHDLGQELLLQVEHGMRVCEQKPTADGADEGEDEAPGPQPEPARPHHPLEDPERQDEHDEGPVLQDVGERHALPEPRGSQRPRSGIVAKEQEHRHGEKDQGPVARYAYASTLERREQAHGEN